MPRLFDSDYHDCVSRCCLGLARRLTQTSSDRFAARLRLGSYPYGLGAFPLAFRGGSVRVDSVVRVDRGTSSRLRGSLKTHRGSFELDRGTLGGWGELGVAWQRAVSTAGLKRSAPLIATATRFAFARGMPRVTGRRPAVIGAAVSTGFHGVWGGAPSDRALQVPRRWSRLRVSPH